MAFGRKKSSFSKGAVNSALGTRFITKDGRKIPIGGSSINLGQVQRASRGATGVGKLIQEVENIANKQKHTKVDLARLLSIKKKLPKIQHSQVNLPISLVKGSLGIK